MRNSTNPAMRALVATLFYDVGLSVIAYFVAELLGASSYLSLLVGTLVAGLRLGWVAIHQRRLDPFATFLLTLFGAGLALTFVTGDARFILARDSAMSGTAGLVLVGSCLVGRPLVYYAARRLARSAGPAARQRFEAGADTPAMRSRWFRISLVWGVSLLVDSGLRITAVYLLPIGVAANVSQGLLIAVYGLLILWTVHSARRTRITTRTRLVS